MLNCEAITVDQSRACLLCMRNHWDETHCLTPYRFSCVPLSLTMPLYGYSSAEQVKQSTGSCSHIATVPTCSLFPHMFTVHCVDVSTEQTWADLTCEHGYDLEIRRGSLYVGTCVFSWILETKDLPVRKLNIRSFSACSVTWNSGHVNMVLSKYV